MISTSAFVVLTQLCIIFAGDGADVDVIVAAVLLPLTVLLVSILLFTTCLCVCCSTRSKQRYVHVDRDGHGTCINIGLYYEVLFILLDERKNEMKFIT